MVLRVFTQKGQVGSDKQIKLIVLNNYLMCDYYMQYVYSVASCSSSDASSVPSACVPAASLSPLPGQLRPLAIH